ncbi:hypothetical protein ABQW72_00005, partial [Xanthomonas hortorum pv. pelargonii]
PSSVININRRPLILAGIELRGVDSGAGGSTYQNQPSSWRLKNWFFVAEGGAVVCAVGAD